MEVFSSRLTYFRQYFPDRYSGTGVPFADQSRIETKYPRTGDCASAFYSGNWLHDSQLPIFVQQPRVSTTGL